MFFINLVIGVVAIVLCWVYLPKTPKFKEDMLDWVGGVIVMAGLICLILGLTFLPPARDNQLLGGILVATGLLILVLFVLWELRHPFAIIPKILLKNKTIMLSLGAGLFNFSMITTVGFQMPFVL